MTYLIYYQEEKVREKEAFEKMLGIEEAEIICAKLLRHFKLPKINPEWTSGRNHPHAGSWSITLNKDWNNFGVLCHEIAHVYQKNNPKMKAYYTDKGFQRWHDKKHAKIMNRMINYCRKKNWFVDEINRRLAPKPIKIVNNLEEKQKELIKTQEKIVRYEKKILFYQRKLSKAKRSYLMKQRWLNKSQGIQQ